MTYVMSDIHGNLQRFECVMSKINLQPEDTLYILGDVIDRAPDGIEILRRIIKMPNVKMLLGNHEYMMLCSLYYGVVGHFCDEYESCDHHMNIWYNNKGKVTQDSLKQLSEAEQQEIFEYLDRLPLNIEVTVNGRKFILVHGGIEKNFFHYSNSHSKYECRNQKEYCVWARDADTIYVPKGKTLIFGHTPTRHFQNVQPMALWKGKNRYGIDCGCGFREDGRLCCLRLDDMQAFYSDYNSEEERKYYEKISKYQNSF